MRLVDLCEVADEVQEQFLCGLPEAMLYHSPKYHRILIEMLGCRQRSAAVLDGDELMGIAPVMECEGPLGRVLNSLPFYGSHGGLLVRNEAARRLLSEWYLDLTGEAGLAAATMVENPLTSGPSVEVVTGDFNDDRIGQLTPLNADKATANGLMTSLHSKTRNMVRKAVSSGLTVGQDGAQLHVLARIHGENMRAMSASPKPDRFFELVPRLFQEGDDWNCWVCRKDDEVAAALLVFHFNGITEYFIPALRDEYRSTQALSLVIFEAMLDAARRGMRWWNWGGTWRSQESVYRFKSRWGTVAMPYHYRTVVKNPELLSVGAGELLAGYPHFYVIPFGALNGR